MDQKTAFVEGLRIGNLWTLAFLVEENELPKRLAKGALMTNATPEAVIRYLDSFYADGTHDAVPIGKALFSFHRS